MLSGPGSGVAASTVAGWALLWNSSPAMTHLQFFYRKGSSLWNFICGQFGRNSSLPGSFSQALAILWCFRQLMGNSLAKCFLLLPFDSAFLCIGTSYVVIKCWVNLNWLKKSLFPVNNSSFLLQPDCHLLKMYLIPHLNKYGITSPLQLASDSITPLVIYHTYL